MPHPDFGASLWLDVRSPSHRPTGPSSPVVHRTSPRAHPGTQETLLVDLPALPSVRREIGAMLATDAPPPRQAGVRRLRLWLHARALWLERALRP